MLKVDDSVKGLEFEFRLDARQTAIIASAVKQEWFEIIQKLMEDEVKRMNIRLINTPAGSREDVLANHAVAKGAGMFYIGFIQRLEQLLAEAHYAAEGIGSMENPEQPPYQPEFTESTVDPNDEVS